MLNAFAGGESLEILVMLKDLSSAGLLKLQGNIKRAEMTANSTNFSGFSKSAKTLEKDAAAAAGRGGVGGVAGLGAAFLGIPAPIAVAGAAIVAFTAISAATVPVYEKVEQQNNLLDAAFKAHGASLDALRPKIQEQIKLGEGWGFNADQTRSAILELAQAGHKWTDIAAAMPTILRYAQAKHLDLAEAAKTVELATVGNAKALREAP